MATVTWIGGTSIAWGTGTNWSGGSEPSGGDTVYIDGNVSIAGVDKSAVNVAAATTLTTANVIDSVLLNHAGTFTTVNVIGRSAEFKHYHTAIITTVNVKAGGFFNGAVDRRTKTITNVILHKAGRFAAGNMTLTNGVKGPSRLTATDYTDLGAAFTP